MKELTLIRHAKSSWTNAALSDFERPLGERGLRDAPSIGAYLARSQFPTPGRIVSSPALRAITTAELIAHQLGMDRASIEKEPRIYEASLARLFAVVSGFDDALGHIIMVGHNPGFERLARALHPPFVGDGEKFPTCGLAHMQLAIGHWAEVTDGCAHQAEFICPKMLAADDTQARNAPLS